MRFKLVYSAAAVFNLLLLAVEPASATTFTLPSILVRQFTGDQYYVGVTGSTSDGATLSFSQSSNKPLAKLGATTNANKSNLTASATADVGIAKLNVSLDLNAGQSGVIIGVVRSGSTFAINGATGLIKGQLDPTMTATGSGTAKMNFTAVLNGSTIYAATATLDSSGNLSTTGSLQPSDFTVSTASGRATATLNNVNFSIPVSFTPAQMGQNVPFEFDQTFTSTGSNGGSANVDGTSGSSSGADAPIPPWAIMLLGSLLLYVSSRSLRGNRRL